MKMKQRDNLNLFNEAKRRFCIIETLEMQKLSVKMIHIFFSKLTDLCIAVIRYIALYGTRLVHFKRNKK